MSKFVFSVLTELIVALGKICPIFELLNIL